MALTFKIDGVEYVHLIKAKGLKWSRNDMDDGAERVIEDAQMQRNRIAVKGKFEIQLRPITAVELAQICTAVAPEYIDITYLDPATNTVTIRQFYGSTISAAVYFVDKGTVMYDNCSFNLIER